MEAGRLVVRLYMKAPAGSLIGTAGREAPGSGLLRGFVMGPCVGDLSTGSQKYGLFARFFHGAQCPAGGGVEQVENMKNMRFIVFYKCHGTPNGNKTKKEIKRDDFNSTALLEALARQFIRGWRKRCPPATDPDPPDGRHGERVGRGVDLIETTAKPPVAQRAGGIPDLDKLHPPLSHHYRPLRSHFFSSKLVHVCHFRVLAHNAGEPVTPESPGAACEPSAMAILGGSP